MFREAGVPAALMGTLDDLTSDAQLPVNRITVTTRDGSGSGPPLINHPVNVTGLPRSKIQPAPDLGQHSEEILGTLGFTSAEIAELRSQRVI